MKQTMKILILSAICTLFSFSAYGQGTIQLSNLNKAKVTYFYGGTPVGNSVQVSFATPDGTLVGNTVNVAGAGYFLGGKQTLDGLTGTVELVVAAWDLMTGDGIYYSDPFSVTLGGTGTPPAPDAAIPADFTGVVIGMPEPSTIALSLLGGAALLIRRRQ